MKWRGGGEEGAGVTPASRAVRVMKRRRSSQPDLMLMAELSVVVSVSMASITFSRSSVTVPNGSCLM